MARKNKFALDTNVLIDMGEGKSFAHSFLDAYQDKGLCVPPTVVQELAHIASQLNTGLVNLPIMLW